MLSEGEVAPDFTLPDQDGDPFTLSELRGQTVVLYFYPRAGASGCTTQACGVRDHHHDYERFHTRVIGVSPDDVEAVAEFHAEHDLGFTLLADPDHAAADAYGTWVEKQKDDRTYWGAQRSTFIIDGEGKIARVFPEVSPETHDDVVLEALRELAR